MTNENEAFEKWFENTVLNDNIHDVAEWAWSAAVAYMQEQSESAEQSEPVATIYNGNAYWIGKEPPEGTNLFTTPQRQKPLKRLDDSKIKEVIDAIDFSQMVTADDLHYLIANAIMDAMERINK